MNFLGLSSPPILVLCLSCALVMSVAIADTDEDTNTVSCRGERNLNTLITEEMMENVFKSCEDAIKARRELEEKLYNQGRVVKTNSRKTDPSLIRMRKTDPIVNRYEWAHMAFHEATYQLYNRFNLTRDEIVRALQSIPLTGELSKKQRAACTRDMSPDIRCDSTTKFRTADGSCNNLQNPMWGRAMTCQIRVMDPHYVGNSGYRRSVVNNEPLPNPRLISLDLHENLNRPTNYVSHIYMYFGQVLDHDIALTPTSTTMDNEAIQCCPVANETHPQCVPILPAPNDPFYGPNNVTCLNFVRSAMCATCNLGPKQVMNQLTSFIDLSFVYGNSENETNSLRTNDGTGRLRVQRSRYGDLLPPSSNPNDDQCSFPENNQICFEAGDSRVNQHPVLTTLQTIFMREHNRLADGLRAKNPHWDGNRIFQEARRINIAQFQMIVYNEFLPATLGPDRMSYFKLWVLRSGYTLYNSRVDASLIVEFSTAAYRYGHSLINSVISNTPRNATDQRRLLRDYFFEPFELYQGLTGPLLRGASNSPAQWFDRHMVPDVTNYLYRVRGDPTGLDLAAININRGRDHGLPPYVDVVQYCSDGKIVVKDFNDLLKYKLTGEDQVSALMRNYRDARDIDLWSGILVEYPLKGAVVGPTAACLIGWQFKNWKVGDRFYFEHSNTPGRFDYAQLMDIRKITLSKIICLNTDVPQIALNAMLFSSMNNPNINCRQVRGVEFALWKENKRSTSMLQGMLDVFS